MKTKIKISIFVALLAVGIAGSILYIDSNVGANNYAARIKALESDISEYDAKALELSKQSDSLSRELDRLSNDKAKVQAKINISQQKVKLLNAEIKETEARIEENRDTLGTTIADLYVDDSISTVELLFSSDGVGDFIDKQEYRSSIRDKLTSTIREIKSDKAKLEESKKAAEAVLRDEESQRSLLADKEAEQANLLAATRNDEAAYKKLSKESAKEKERLQREQQREIDRALGGVSAVPGDPNKGGYPAYLANSNYYAPLVDPWGMYSRQCVSYTAWKVHQAYTQGKTTHDMPWWGGDRYVTINGSRHFTSGHAKYWPTSARAAGIPVGTTPRANSVGVITAGQYGHTVWVERVNGDGTVDISQYNSWNHGGSGWGHYSEAYGVSASAYDYYIYF